MKRKKTGFGGNCTYCGRATYFSDKVGLCRATKDHVEAKAFGGQTTVRACDGCNGVKSHFPASVFRSWLSRGNDSHAPEAKLRFNAFVCDCALAGLPFIRTREAARQDVADAFSVFRFFEGGA